MNDASRLTDPELVRLHRLARAVAAEPIEADERRAALRCLIDAVGCALSATREPVVTRVVDAAVRESAGSATGYSLIGHSRRVSLSSALLCNAAAIRAQDLNDVFSRRNNNHPSESVIPIALAAAERAGMTGAELVDAVAIGYRLSLTIGECWSGLLGRGWAPAATLGQISSTAFIAHLLGVDHDVAVDAMALSVLTSPVLAAVFRGELSDAKSLVSGMAAQTAWRSIILAQSGVTGPRDALEASGGFDELIGGTADIPEDASGTVDARSIWLKAHPAVFNVHAAIDAAIAVSRELTPDELTHLGGGDATIEVRVPEKVAGMSASPARWTPATREAAQFSLPHCTAVALLHGSCGLEQLEASLGSDAGRTRALIDRMTVEPDARWSGYSGAEVSVVLSDGRTVRHTVDHAKGSPENPLDDRELEAKFTSLVATPHGEQFAKSALAAVAGAERAEDAQGLLRALVAPARERGSA